MSNIWTIEYWVETDEISKWFENLDEASAEAVFKELGLLEIFGNTLRLPHSRALGINFLSFESADLDTVFIIRLRVAR